MPQDSDGIDDAIWSSKSTDSSVEHIFHEIPTTGDYEFWVYQQGAIVIPDDAADPFGYRQFYGLAWWTQTGLTATADFNNDTMVDGADLAQWEGGFGVNDDLTPTMMESLTVTTSWLGKESLERAFPLRQRLLRSPSRRRAC